MAQTLSRVLPADPVAPSATPSPGPVSVMPPVVPTVISNGAGSSNAGNPANFHVVTNSQALPQVWQVSNQQYTDSDSHANLTLTSHVNTDNTAARITENSSTSSILNNQPGSSLASYQQAPVFVHGGR